MARPEGLTPKEILFIKGLAAGKTKRDAAFEAYDAKNLNTAAAIASETLKKPNVQAAYRAELEKQGITIEAVVAPVVKALQAKRTYYVDGKKIETDDDDLEMQLKGHDRVMKILDVNKDKEPQGNTINFINNANFKSGKYVD